MVSAEELDVLLGDVRVGTLVRTRKGARFAYSAEAQDKYLGRPLLSASLPVKQRPYSEGLTRAWFEGLLPEGERLSRICSEIACRTYDYFGILWRIGWECAGAVCICPQEDGMADEASLQSLSVSELVRTLNELPEYHQGKLVRTCLGGFQEKVVLVASDVNVANGRVKEARWSVPNAAAISTHIVKPQPRTAHPGIVEGEAWAMEVARAAARCAKSALLELEGAPTSLLVERFDRSRDHGVMRRLHQEDCCQALGLLPTQKYADAQQPKRSDPTYVRIAALLDRYAADPLQEKDELLRQLVTNLAIGNVDAHAKNYAFLYGRPCVLGLSPMYDVVPVTDIEPRARHLSMRVNGKILADEVTHADVVGEARSWGMGTDRASSVVAETLERIGHGIERASALYPVAAERHAAPTRERLHRLA